MSHLKKNIQFPLISNQNLLQSKFIDKMFKFIYIAIFLINIAITNWIFAIYYLQGTQLDTTFLICFLIYDIVTCIVFGELILKKQYHELPD